MNCIPDARASPLLLVAGLGVVGPRPVGALLAALLDLVGLGVIVDVVRGDRLGGGRGRRGRGLDLHLDVELLGHGGPVALPLVVAVVVGRDVALPLAALLGPDVLDLDAALVDGRALVADVLEPALKIVASGTSNLEKEDK